jgi:hypothetical protein
MADQDGLTIETEPAKGGNEFGPAGTDTKTVGLTEDELRERGAAFDEWFGVTAPVTVKDVLEPGDTELVRSTKEFLVRAAVRAEEDRAEDLEQPKLFREASAASGGWVPGNPSEAQRQELRADYQRRQEWNSLIEGGSVAADSKERGIQDRKPPAQLSKQEIVTEAREVHARLEQLTERFEQAQGAERAQLRQEMKPLAVRENELRDEYTGRLKDQEMGDKRDTVSQTWLERQAKLIRQADIAVAVEDVPLAMAYYNGWRQAYNSAREDVIENHPERAKDLPAAIEVDEIRVRQQVMEQEQKDRSLEIA